MTEVTPANTPTARYLWVAVGVLGAATISLGAVLLNPQWRSTAPAPLEPVSAVAPVQTTQAAQVASAAAVVAPTPPIAPPDSLGSNEAVVPAAVVPDKKRAPARVNTAQAAPKNVAHRPAVAPVKAATVPPPQPAPPAESPAVTTEWPAEPIAPAGSAKAAKVVCARCGTVQSVTPVQREAAKGSGVGVLVGGALGGLLGNQVGGGDGKTVATVLGAVGGGWAGNEVEKRMKKETVYQVTVRMQDGSIRQVERAESIAVGTAVTVEGDTIRPQTTPE